MRIMHILLLVLAAVAASGCAAFDDSANAGPGDKPLVVTSFTILEDMAREVAGDRAEVRSITKPGAEIHHYEPTPRDIANAHGADLVIANGMGLELWFDQFLQQLGDVRHIDASDGVKAIPIVSGSYEGKANPHAWMSPTAAHVYVTNIRDGLIEIDPEGADEYTANAERYLEQIDVVDEQLRTELATLPAKQRTLTSCEGAFSYLTSDYDMQELYLWPINAESQGTPAQIASVVDAVRADDVPAVFCESTVNADAQEQVAAETGARFAGKLYVDSLSKADGPVPTYLQLLQYDADMIIKGLTR
jgi:manganese transport system substrate-binding protein